MQLVTNTLSQHLVLVTNFPPLPPVLATSSPATPCTYTYPKLSSPLDFNRDYSIRQAFLNSCALYICLALEQFSCKEKKILWALTFFKGGHTVKWSKNLFCQKVDTRCFPIQAWADFKAQFKVQFFLVNAEADMVNTLEGTSYHQGTQMVEDYLNGFQLLISDAGYTNPQTLIVKF